MRLKSGNAEVDHILGGGSRSELIVETRQRYLEVLAINRALASADDYEEVLRRVVDRTAAFTGATACVLLLSREDGLARVVRSVGIDPAKAARLAVPLTERIDVELCRILGFQPRDGFVGVPVIGTEGLMGMLAVYWEGAQGLDRESEVELISAVADQAAIALDNRERVRRLRASEAKLAGIISTAADAIISVDEAQRIVMYNEAAQTIFGWAAPEVLGKPLDILLPEGVRVVHRQHVEIEQHDQVDVAGIVQLPRAHLSHRQHKQPRQLVAIALCAEPA